MKTKHLISLLAGTILAASCSSDAVIEDFESDASARWNIDGNAFVTSDKMASSDCAFNVEDIKGIEGNVCLCSISSSTVQGTMTSNPFTIGKKYINLLIGGTSGGWTHSPVSVNLIIDGERINTVSPVGSSNTVLEWMSWDVAQYQGQEASIQVIVEPARTVGTRAQKQGWILLDQITMSDKNYSDYLPEYTASVRIDKDYILIPASNKGMGSRLSVNIGQENILGTLQRVSIATDEIEYWIPVNVSAYKGQTAEVTLTGVRQSYKTYGGIVTDNDIRIDYDEPFRPVYHFSPLYGWTNDPNGMVYKDGEWHLSYQFNPYGTTHGNMHWGHAVSKDLINWEHLPLVIAPDELGSIFSGSAVVDTDNTAGFGKDAIVAIYTSASAMQRQSIAYSLDNGRTFTKYNENPVLADPEQRDFRDPKVAWIDGKWVMSLAVGDVIRFYGSDDLRNWELLSEFGRGIGSHAAVWECPDLMKFTWNGQEKWVLLVSINPGGPNGGSVTQYFIGNFDGKKFTADPLPYPLWIDLGTDNYAGVTFGNVASDRHVFMGWMSNWWYTNQTPTRYFRNSMTIPRDLSLKHNGKHLILASTPSPEILKARGKCNEFESISLTENWKLEQISESNSGAYEIDLTIVPETGRKLNLSLLNSKGENAAFSFDFNDLSLSLDRSESGLVDFSPKYVTTPIVTPIVRRNEYKIQLFVDRLSTEMFINDGDVVFTNCVFPTERLNSLLLESKDGSFLIKDFCIYEMNNNK